MTKDFLYLVQSRASVAEKHLSLESSRSDVLIYTFDRQIDRPGFLFRANTTWAEGRNILIEAAEKLPQSYKYYVLLDDDVKFIKGTCAQFEEAVLKVKPDLAIPVYNCHHQPKSYSKITPFPYSDIVHNIDCCFICLSKDLFFDRGADRGTVKGLDRALLPYKISVPTSQGTDLSIYSTAYFWASLFEYYSDKRILAINKFQHINELHLNTYDYNHESSYDKAFHTMKSKDPGFSNRLQKQRPELLLFTWHSKASQNYHEIIRTIERRILKLPPEHLSSNPHYNKKSMTLSLIKQLVAQRQYSYIFKLLKLRLFSKCMQQILAHKKYFRLYTYPLCLWRDLKLNLRILFEKNT
ncbi:MAG: hypothetical protein K0U41_04370 [Gammaproteobacteria bacterium]|nr:hypothetical protein [Gammaproteobacteria bacterium]